MAASGSLKCKTWVLKVSIHCEGCKREVKKALHKLEGVYKISVDSQQHKVTVTGNISSEALLSKLARIGKHAQVVQENDNANTQVTAAAASQAATHTSHKTANPAKNSNPAGKPVAKGKTEGVEEKEHNSPKGKQSQITIPDPTEADSGSSQEIVLSYDSAHLSSGRTHDLYHQCIPSQPSVYADADQLKTVQDQLLQEQGREVRASSMNSFDMFSEENANGCSIM